MLPFFTHPAALPTLPLIPEPSVYMWVQYSVAASASAVMDKSFESGIDMVKGEGRIGCWVDGWMVSTRRGLVG